MVIKKLQNESVKSGIRTHAHIRGPERPEIKLLLDKYTTVHLESGALDRSAILTDVRISLLKIRSHLIQINGES